MNRILKFIILDIIKNKFVLLYACLLAALSWSTFSFDENSTKGLLTLLNIILLTVPLVSILFSTIYIYNSSEFIELLLAQPLRRETIWMSLFSGLSLSLVLGFLAGAGIPILLFAPTTTGIIMTVVGSLLTLVFVSIAFLCAIWSRDKAKGIGISILMWLYFAIIFDGLVLFLTFQFADYPIEKPMIIMSAFSPIDISRILILLQLDVSVMMGYTGAVFKDFFGTTPGFAVSLGILLAWIVIPFYISLRRFKRKDL
jgi:Cu-processing system permease protein